MEVLNGWLKHSMKNDDFQRRNSINQVCGLLEHDAWATQQLLGIADALLEVGEEVIDVTRTRMFFTDIDRWEKIGPSGIIVDDVDETWCVVDFRRHFSASKN